MLTNTIITKYDKLDSLVKQLYDECYEDKDILKEAIKRDNIVLQYICTEAQGLQDIEDMIRGEAREYKQ